MGTVVLEDDDCEVLTALGHRWEMGRLDGLCEDI